MIRRPPRSTLDRSSAASDVYKRQVYESKLVTGDYVWQNLANKKYEANFKIDAFPNGFFFGNISSVGWETPQDVLVKLNDDILKLCLLYTSPSPRDRTRSRMPSSA